MGEEKGAKIIFRPLLNKRPRQPGNFKLTVALLVELFVICFVKKVELTPIDESF